MSKVLFKRVQGNFVKETIIPFETLKEANEWVKLIKVVDKGCTAEVLPR